MTELKIQKNYIFTVNLHCWIQVEVRPDLELMRNLTRCLHWLQCRLDLRLILPELCNNNIFCDGASIYIVFATELYNLPDFVSIA